MRALYLSLLFFSSVLTAAAQRSYFFYIQTDNNTPFYIKTGDQLQSSTASGYLILPGLPDQDLQFIVGFPGSRDTWRFKVSPTGRDRGFLIRRGEAGAQLYDWVSGTTVKPEKGEREGSVVYQERTDAFTKRLATAADDPSLLYAAVNVPEPSGAVAQQPKKETSTPAETMRTDSSITLNETTAKVDKPLVTEEAPAKKEKHLVEEEPLKTEPKKEGASPDLDSALAKIVEPSANAEVRVDTLVAQVKTEQKPQLEAEPVVETHKKSTVRKHAESSTSEGFGLVYYDYTERGIDTIRLVIPNQRFQLKPNDEAEAEARDITVQEKEKPVAAQARPACLQQASAQDFLKLRKAMAAEDTDEDMVSVARKAFKTKCYSTEQVKNLSALFLTSAGKYLFFDAAYLHVSDAANFRSLQAEIRDEYYLKRFKALVGE